MDLMDSYLHLNFISEDNFLILNNCSHSELLKWQKNKILSAASYTTNNTVKITSFSGVYNFSRAERWYPKGLCEWVRQIKDLQENPSCLKAIFFNRYRDKISELGLCGLSDHIYNNESEFSALLQTEWQHFLNGTYGVCTRDCSPEHIAVKDMTVRVIDRVTNRQQKEMVTGEDLKLLILSVNLLDAVCSSFAPHEKDRSSRKRCIESVREKYISLII